MRLCKLLPVLALVAAPSFAQEAHFGAQVGVSFPQGDLKDTDTMGNKLGYTAGINLGLEFQGGHVLRPRMDYTQYKRTDTAIFAEPIDLKITTLFCGADYSYFVGGKADQGFYLLAGLGYTNTKTAVSGSTYNSSQSKGAFAYAVGAGFQFTPMIGAEVRYNSSRPVFYGETIKIDAVSAAITLRF